MIVNPLTGIFSGASAQLQRTATRIQSTIDSLISGNRVTRASDDVAALSIASQLQSRNVALKEAGRSIAQSMSAMEIAAGGVGKQQEIVERLKQLAVQANTSVLDEGSRKALNAEFQGLLRQLDSTASSVQFNGQPLFDGNYKLSVDTSGGEEEPAEFALPDLSASGLLGGTSLNLLSAEGAQKALQSLADASAKITQARADVGSVAGALGYASANLASVIFNQEAARSELTDADFAGQSTLLALLNAQQQGQVALAAQSNRLQPALLQLLS